jgi:hypothetical protein
MRSFVTTSWPFFGMALFFAIGIVMGRLTAPRDLRKDDFKDEEEETEADTLEIERILGAFAGPKFYIAPSPLLKFREPLLMATALAPTMELPVIQDSAKVRTSLGITGCLLLLWTLFWVGRMPETRSYVGRHRPDGYTPKQLGALTTPTMLLPILEHTKKNGLTMEMPWRGEEVFA